LKISDIVVQKREQHSSPAKVQLWQMDAVDYMEGFLLANQSQQASGLKKQFSSEEKLLG